MYSHASTLNTRLAALRADGYSIGKMFAVNDEADYAAAITALNETHTGNLSFVPCPNLALYPFGNKNFGHFGFKEDGENLLELAGFQPCTELMLHSIESVDTESLTETSPRISIKNDPADGLPTSPIGAFVFERIHQAERAHSIAKCVHDEFPQ